MTLDHPQDGSFCVCVLSDGQGGQAGGAEAAQKAVAVSIEQALSYPASRLLNEKVCASILMAADDAIDDSDEAGYCTLVALVATESHVFGVSCGDSAALLFHASQTIELTVNQRKNPPVGSRSAKPVVFTKRLRPPWKLLVMSDGVWKYAGMDTVARLLEGESSADLFTALRGAALRNGRLWDDFTVSLLECMG